MVTLLFALTPFFLTQLYSVHIQKTSDIPDFGAKLMILVCSTDR